MKFTLNLASSLGGFSNNFQGQDVSEARDSRCDAFTQDMHVWLQNMCLLKLFEYNLYYKKRCVPSQPFSNWIGKVEMWIKMNKIALNLKIWHAYDGAPDIAYNTSKTVCIKVQQKQSQGRYSTRVKLGNKDLSYV